MFEIVLSDAHPPSPSTLTQQGVVGCVKPLGWASVWGMSPERERSALEQVAVRPCSGAGQLYVAGRRGSIVNPSFPSTLTAPVFPPSKSPEARRWPVANS
jgi:hypothetical protein